MRVRVSFLMGLFAAAALIGCGEGETTPAPPSTDPVIVDYVRTGGLAGVQEHLVLYRGGRATLVKGDSGPPEEIEVTAAQREAVEGALSESGFSDMSRVQRTIPEPDGFNYVIRHDRHTVLRESAGLEPQLQPVVRHLDAIVAAN